MITYLLLIVFFSNLIIGIFLGISGISGFLLPMIYVGFLDMPVKDSLALSFLAFAVSGVIAALSYLKSKNMDLRLALYLSIGSIPGAFLGVQINVLISDTLAKLFLYLFVLVAGLSLFKQNKERIDIDSRSMKILNSNAVLMIIGLLTASISSLTGAGGPILLVPLLASLGINIRIAVGVSLLNSVIIAIPAIFGYFAYATMDNIWTLIASSLIGITAGILTGAYYATKVPTQYLRLFIGIITIITAVYMLISLFIT